MIKELAGLRFFAAIFVILAHFHGGKSLTFLLDGGQTLVVWPQSISALGMTLFFTLSSVVIHYVYSQSVCQKFSLEGWCTYIWHRFSRLYPLFIFGVIIALGITR
jgi:peptidoglycan/LPS O-acetylase OafA/YrhL